MSLFFRRLSITFATINLLLMALAPLLCRYADQLFGRDPRSIGIGLQELLVYFDPMFARSTFPGIFTLGWVLLPFLLRGKSPTETAPEVTGRFMVFALISIILCEALFLTLVAVQVFCRGPHWNFFWPWEEFDEFRVTALDSLDLSDLVWRQVIGDRLPANPMIRELPGIVALTAYFVVGVVVAWRSALKESDRLRFIGAMFVLQLALLLPIKVSCRVLGNVKYIVSLREYGLNV